MPNATDAWIPARERTPNMPCGVLALRCDGSRIRAVGRRHGTSYSGDRRVVEGRPG